MELSQYTDAELKGELERRAGIVRVSTPDGDIEITESDLNKRAMLIVDQSNELLIQYPDGHNEYSHSIKPDFNRGGFTGHRWFLNSLKTGEFTFLAWL